MDSSGYSGKYCYAAFKQCHKDNVDPVTGAAGYDIEIYGTAVDVGAQEWYIHEGINSNNQQTYRVRAKLERRGRLEFLRSGNYTARYTFIYTDRSK